MANQYVVFYTNGNQELADFLVKRAKELGYTVSGNLANYLISVSLSKDTGEILWTSKCDGAMFSNHEYGDFEKFLTTDFYKYTPPKPPKPSIVINGYSKVGFTSYGVEFNVGNKIVYLSNKEVEDIYNRIKENKAEGVELDPPF